MWVLLDTSWGIGGVDVITDEDGENEVFETKEEADAYADENLQSALAVEIN